LFALELNTMLSHRPDQIVAVIDKALNFDQVLSTFKLAVSKRERFRAPSL
jgi:hypothetical protein